MADTYNALHVSVTFRHGTPSYYLRPRGMRHTYADGIGAVAEAVEDMGERVTAAGATLDDLMALTAEPRVVEPDPVEPWRLSGDGTP